MKLFKVWQDQVQGCNTFSEIVVCAEDKISAAHIHPYDMVFPTNDNWASRTRTWCNRPEMALVEYLGEARPGLKKGVICRSFHTS